MYRNDDIEQRHPKPVSMADVNNGKRVRMDTVSQSNSIDELSWSMCMHRHQLLLIVNMKATTFAIIVCLDESSKSMNEHLRLVAATTTDNVKFIDHLIKERFSSVLSPASPAPHIRTFSHFSVNLPLYKLPYRLYRFARLTNFDVFFFGFL